MDPNTKPNQEINVEIEDTLVEVEDDTPPEDRGREPLPTELVQELEKDDLEDYSEKVKVRLKQMKKVWHDERRAKEAADRERQEAIALAQKVIEENRALKSRVSEATKDQIERELDKARKEHQDAFSAGDSERLSEASEKLALARVKMEGLKQAETLQEQETDVNTQPYVPQPDKKAVAWQERNAWFGKNRLMTGMALGLHEELVQEHGPAYAATDEYYARIDKTMRERFPEQFREETQVGGGKPSQRTPATVVAPASRSTAPKKVVLKQSQVELARKLGISQEQYAREFAKLQER
jgi:hypothetical protein